MTQSHREPSKNHWPNSLYIPMTSEEVKDFLEKKWIMIVSTVCFDGWPQSTPVWYIFHEGRIYFRAQSYKVKIKNLRKNSKISCCVEAGEVYPELRGVSIQGSASIVTDQDRNRKLQRILIDKYALQRRTEMMPPDWRAKHGSEERTLVEVTIRKIVSWDNRKWLEKNV